MRRRWTLGLRAAWLRIPVEGDHRLQPAFPCGAQSVRQGCVAAMIGAEADSEQRVGVVPSVGLLQRLVAACCSRLLQPPVAAALSAALWCGTVRVDRLKVKGSVATEVGRVGMNMVVARLRSPDGASAALSGLAMRGRFTLLLSVALALEYEAASIGPAQRLASCLGEAEGVTSCPPAGRRGPAPCEPAGGDTCGATRAPGHVEAGYRPESSFSRSSRSLSPTLQLL